MIQRDTWHMLSTSVLVVMMLSPSVGTELHEDVLCNRLPAGRASKDCITRVLLAFRKSKQHVHRLLLPSLLIAAAKRV
jgi:hypothetical protein